MNAKVRIRVLGIHKIFMYLLCIIVASKKRFSTLIIICTQYSIFKIVIQQPKQEWINYIIIEDYKVAQLLNSRTDPKPLK